MMSTAPLAVDRATEQVEGMIYRGDAFTRVEDAIDAARLSQHHKAALWAPCLVASRPSSPTPRRAADGASVRSRRSMRTEAYV